MLISPLHKGPYIERLFLFNAHQLIAVGSNRITQHMANDLKLTTLVVIFWKCAKCLECIFVTEGSIPSILMLLELSCLWEVSKVNQQYIYIQLPCSPNSILYFNLEFNLNRHLTGPFPKIAQLPQMLHMFNGGFNIYMET